MKHIIGGFVTTIVGVLIILGILTINVRQQREIEVSEALNHSVKQALINIEQDKKCEVFGNTEEDYEKSFIADFCELLINEIETGSEKQSDKKLRLKVDVAGVDYDKGLLAVKVTEEFSYPVFGKGSVSVSSTAVVDTNYDKTVNYVTFYDRDGTTVFKRFVVSEGEMFQFPGSNPWEGQGYWIDADGNKYTNANDSKWPQCVDKNYTFKAVY